MFNNDNDNDDNDELKYMKTKNKQEKNQENIIIGIDLGTTNTCACIWRNNAYEIIPDEFGNNTVPSIVSYSCINKYVGLEAKKQKEINIANVFYETKRLIGRKYNDKFIKKCYELLSYDIVMNERECISFKTHNNKLITPEEISAEILIKIKQNACNYLNRPITDVVITVPAHFNESQRQSTQDACKIAGLNCIRILNEPTAGAIAFGMIEKSLETQKMILVYDFGGGTLDCSLIDVFNGCFEVQGSSGITHFGGVDFDNKLINLCIAKFSRKYYESKLEVKDISKINLQKLRTMCENAKKILSIDLVTEINLENFYENNNLYIKLTRKDFENICRDLFLLCLSPIDDLLNECNKIESDIDEVILIGGMTRIPFIREIIKNKFNNNKTKINCNIDPDIAVAVGAAIQGYIISNKDDVFSNSLTLLDVSPLSLGLEVVGGAMDILIKRNTMIPCEKTKLYTTDSDNIERVLIKIFEGERSLTEFNFKIGEFELDKIPQQLKGVPEIEITFEININGMVIVKATEKEGGSSKSIIVNTNKNGLSQAQLQELINNAIENEALDEIQRLKKYNYYEINTMCNNILCNLIQSKLSEQNIKNIKDDIELIFTWLKEKKYIDRDNDEYIEIINKIKNKYGVLILHTNKLIVKDNSENTNATTIYGKDDDEDEEAMKEQFEKINDNQDNDNQDNQEIKEIKEIRNELKELCENISGVLYETKQNYEEKYLNEVIQYIDDVMLWYYSVEKPTKLDYESKINHVNLVCNELIENNKNTNNTNNLKEKSINEKLEEQCYMILTLIQNKQLNGSSAKINLLKSYIDTEILDYLYNNENITNDKLHDYYNILNKKYNDICEENINNHYKKDNNIIKKGGMSLLDLIKIKQEEEIDEIINR